MDKSYYAIIPANVRYDEDLTPNAKLLYGEITALCNEKGYCWASNDYFAVLYRTSNRTISRWIQQLINKGYITSKLIYREGTKEVERRYIYIGETGGDKNVTTYRQKCHEGIDKNVTTPIDKNVQDNNTVINNTVNIYKKEKETSLDLIIKEYTNDEELVETLRDFIKMRKSIKSPVTDRALKGILKKLDQLATNNENKIGILEQSIINSWKSVFPLKEQNSFSTNSVSKNNNNIRNQYNKGAGANVNETFRNYDPSTINELAMREQQEEINKLKNK